jgi:NAD(P)-dependent dehydrogenase (short-subunit alcohol dehydrogenase family)
LISPAHTAPLCLAVDFKAAAAMAKRLGTSMTYVSCDVTHQERLSELVQDIGEREGGIHVCVAAAGIIGPPNGCPTQDYPADNFRKVSGRLIIPSVSSCVLKG